jgi:hypothetical protein
MEARDDASLHDGWQMRPVERFNAAYNPRPNRPIGLC